MKTAAKKKPQMHTSDLRALCANKFGAPAYGTLFEVPDATGAWKNRTADLISMSVWPSRGLEVIGAELKVGRGDWLKEMKDPTKAEGHIQHCHRWYLITGPGVVLDGLTEIPSTWGWLEASGGRLMTRKEAPELTPLAPSWAFLAGLFRKLADKAPADMVPRAEMLELAANHAQKDLTSQRTAHEQSLKAVCDKLIEAQASEAVFRQFLQAAGVGEHWKKLEAIGLEKIRALGAAIGLVMGNEPYWIKSIESDKTRMSEHMDLVVNGFRALAATPRGSDG